jgi:hypothetical protein
LTATRLRYEGKESIVLPASATQDAVHRRVDAWLETETGSRYRLQEKYPNGLVLKRTWVSGCWKALLFASIAFSSVNLVNAVSVGYLPFIINQAAYFALWLLFLGCAIIFIFESAVIIDLQFQESVVNLELQATEKWEAEADFASLIRALRENGDVSESARREDLQRELPEKYTLTQLLGTFFIISSPVPLVFAFVHIYVALPSIHFYVEHPSNPYEIFLLYSFFLMIPLGWCLYDKTKGAAEAAILFTAGSTALGVSWLVYSGITPASPWVSSAIWTTANLMFLGILLFDYPWSRVLSKSEGNGGEV